MKRIVFRTVSERIVGEGKPVEINWANVMLAAMRTGGIDGVTIDGMRQRMAVIDRLEAAIEQGRDCVLLETAHQKVLVGVLKAHRFNKVSRAVVEMLDAVENARDVEVTEVTDS
jgi:hypothetical protein